MTIQKPNNIGKLATLITEILGIEVDSTFIQNGKSYILFTGLTDEDRQEIVDLVSTITTSEFEDSWRLRVHI